MDAALNSALTGVRAAGKRLEVSASNTVNARSEAYTPGRVVQEALPSGGVRAEAVPVSPASVPVYAPDHPAADARGIVQRPNVSLDREAVEQVLAQRTFQANLRSLEAADRMAKTVLDILA
jgi:flagellar basal-body rod protein FlgC